MFFSSFLSLLGGVSASNSSTRSIIPRHFNPFLYSGFQTRRTLRRGWTEWTSLGLQCQLLTLQYAKLFGNPLAEKGESVVNAMLTMNERLGRDYEKPGFGIDTVVTSAGPVAVQERVACRKAVASLVHFQRESSRNDPKVLVVAPMSGHYATLLKDTVSTLLIDHEVYITDWHNARDVPVEEGTFGFDDYVRYVIEFLQELGPDTHMLAVCQPTVPCLVATAVMEEAGDPCRPASLTLMGGPIDTAAAPTEVTEFALRYNLEWFERNVIAKVPESYPGAGRLVYPGFLQLTSFLAMNPEKHCRSHVQLFGNLIRDEHSKVEKTMQFYDEYLAVCDLPARFYLETIDRVFLKRDLANNSMPYQDKLVSPSAITRVPLFTVEGEKDDISAPGQTVAAHTICSELPAELRFQYLQPGVGHYGVFSGSRWRSEIAPRVTNFIRRFHPHAVSDPLHTIEAPPLL